MSDRAITVEVGSTNVYADQGYAVTAEMQRKSQLAGEIARAIQAKPSGSPKTRRPCF